MIDDTYKFITGYVQALVTGVERAVDLTPIVVRQKIAAKARLRSNSTYLNYMNALRTKIDNNVLIIEIDEKNWLANAVESGVDKYNMKEGLLNSKNAKISKSGHRYARIPIGKDPNREVGSHGTEKANEYQRLINQVMKKPKFGGSSLKMMQDGSLLESQKLITDNPKAKGLIRFRVHESAQSFHSGKSKGKFGHALLRTVSEKPSKTGATWDHPGIKAANILRDINSALPEIIETLLETNIEIELTEFLSRNR